MAGRSSRRAGSTSARFAAEEYGLCEEPVDAQEQIEQEVSRNGPLRMRQVIDLKARHTVLREQFI